ncbi:LytTR family transcriptional regulator [Hyphobacterium sp. SN044]|uniref:LytR/AlgR family response regulator transcription factor n=1 Tax=Hyphobacterium sp. SN044 TaxID=2912575 RepID=UPI001F38E28E|nr:LytTR family DNA-binding domain-containing protein [Hyphobacterium sp. SN044]MCF8878670.1 LytTR family transcriptional regulator [Hyphobacterium sp. SN044]
MRFLVLFLVFALLAPPAFAQAADYRQTVRLCPVEADQTVPPDFDRPSCESVPLDEVDPQGRALWVELTIDLSDELIASGDPLGLYLSGKMTASAWVNGQRIGSNGTPGVSRAAEIPGRIDAVIFLPRDIVTPGENTVVLQMSTQRGLVHLRNPLQWVAVGPFGDPARYLLRAYWPALVTLGIFVLGLASFGILALRGEDRWASALLAVMSLLAAAQLATETLRGLWSYPYHWHDWRLVGLVVFASLFGTALSALVALKAARLATRARLIYVGAVGAITLAAVLLAGGFDFKTALAVLIPAAAGVALSGWGLWRGHKPAALWMAALAALLLVFRFAESQFLDRHFYLLVAAFLCALFAIQAVSFSRERRQRLAEEARARKLETALDLARERTSPSDIAITAPGRMEKVSTARISHLSGAGDYVEIHTEDGRTLLHGGSLGALEETLPATFLRVHRSHVVNTLFVTALEREASGTGLLTLSTGAVIPVSRRILPAVRQALGVVAGAP